MTKHVYILALLMLLPQMIMPRMNTQRSLKKIKSFFNSYAAEKIDQRELSTVGINAISITNINGPITIKTGWKKNSLLLKTSKRAKKQDDLDGLKTIIDSSKEHYIAISTKHINKKVNGFVEYELIVPSMLDIAITITGNGDAFVKDISGAITISTNDTITVINAKKQVHTKTTKKGETLIVNASGPVNAISVNGNITGTAITNSFIAHAKTGKVSVEYAQLPNTSLVDLETTSGSIALMLPTKTSARITGKTTHGTLLSEHPITLTSYTTKLNSSAWNAFKREVDGRIGDGGATISLRSMHGTVKIVETKMV